MSKPIDLFERWYVEPLKKLEELPNGDGGFVVLATSCFLYERYAKSVLKDKGVKANNNNFIDQLKKDFSISQDTAFIFWDVIRHGFLHQGMGKMKSIKGANKIDGWKTSANHKKPIELVCINGKKILQLEPWLIRDRVLELWRARPDLLNNNKSFPWATIW